MTTTSISNNKEKFGILPDGRAVDLYTLCNANGMVAKVITYGALLSELYVPDKAGNLANVVLGFGNLKEYLKEEYIKNSPYFGAIIGRYANRIAGGKFVLDDVEYTLAKNEGQNTLHGGKQGFDKCLWHEEKVNIGEEPSLAFAYLSKDGEEGFPGNLFVRVIYTLTNQNELKIEYAGTTDKATPLNLTHHSYFNLSGAGVGDVLDHELLLVASKYTPTNETLIPTGEVKSVKNTALDFTNSSTIRTRIADVKGGYDHNYVLEDPRIRAKMVMLAARVIEPKSGRIMEVTTTEPGMQFYTGNFLDGSICGNGGRYYKHYGFCLEAQHFPDSVHHKNFPKVILRPGEVYKQTTTYKFSAQ